MDPDVHRLVLINRICEAFHVLPSQAERELDGDPAHRALLILEQRGYEAAKSAFDRAKFKLKELSAWEGNPMMDLVQTHTYELHQARLAKALIDE